jgi:Lrp/AsnC family transcriptional regulator for asnA, asnC and gidA
MHFDMEKLDLKDKKILYELDYDSRQSNSKIGKKVGLHKNVVTYRIKRLVDRQIIRNFYTVIDSFKLGYNCFRFYLVFRHITPEKRLEILNYFINNKYSWWVGLFEGHYDLAVLIWVKELHDFHVFWEETLKKYHHYFQNQIFCNYVQLIQYRSSFLLEDYDKISREKYALTAGGKKENIDETDFKILEFLAKDSRIPTLDIATNLHISVDTVNNKIKKLIKMDIIQGFRVDIDFLKLGYQFFKVNINLNDYNERGKIINYIRANPYLVMVDKSIGYYDLELDFWLTNLDSFHQIMDDLTEKFPLAIKNYTYVHDAKLYKLLYIPEEL